MGNIREEEDVAEAVVTTQRMVIQAGEPEIEGATAAKAVSASGKGYPMVKKTTPPMSRIETLVTLCSNVPQTRFTPTEAQSGYVGNTIAHSFFVVSQRLTRCRGGAGAPSALPRWRKQRGCPPTRLPSHTTGTRRNGIQDSLPEDIVVKATAIWAREVRAAAADAVGRDVKPDYAVRLTILTCIMRLRPENVVRNLADASPSFRPELLTLRLAPLGSRRVSSTRSWSVFSTNPTRW